MNRVLPLALCAALALPTFGSSAVAQPQTKTHWEPEDGAEIVGRKAPEFAGLIWVNSKPLTLAALKGKPVFVRFWLGSCPMCQGSIPTLNYLYKTYSPKGLVVIGIHHPHGVSCSLESPEKVDVVMHQWGMKFPVALDNDWKTINRYWTGKSARAYTSSSVLIDRAGVIRWVHPGGLLALPASLGGEGDSPAFESLQQAIDVVLKSNAPAVRTSAKPR